MPSWAIQTPTRTDIKANPALAKGTVTQTPVSARNARDLIGNVFVPQKKDKAQSATFADYYAMLKSATSIDSRSTRAPNTVGSAVPRAAISSRAGVSSQRDPYRRCPFQPRRTRRAAVMAAVAPQISRRGSPTAKMGTS